MRAQFHTHIIFHLQANIPPPLENLRAKRRASINIVLSPKLLCSKESLWRSELPSASISLELPLNCWHRRLRRKLPYQQRIDFFLYFQISWNSVTIQTRPSIEARISFPGYLYYERENMNHVVLLVLIFPRAKIMSRLCLFHWIMHTLYSLNSSGSLAMDALWIELS